MDSRGPLATPALGELHRRFEQSIDAVEAFFAREAPAVAACAAAMADRFFAGGRLLVLGTGTAAADAQHNSVEYVHPVLPGCRALPALSLANDVATLSAGLLGAEPDAVFARQIRVLGGPGDICLAFADLPAPAAAVRGLEAAAAGGLLGVAVVTGTGDPGLRADHLFQVEAEDVMVAREVHLAVYHVLWELVHIVLNHRGIPAERGALG